MTQPKVSTVVMVADDKWLRFVYCGDREFEIARFRAGIVLSQDKIDRARRFVNGLVRELVEEAKGSATWVPTVSAGGGHGPE